MSYFVEDPVNFEELNFNDRFELEFETQDVKIYTSLTIKIVVAGVYRSPNGCFDYVFEEFERLLTKLFLNSFNSFPENKVVFF